MRPASTIVLLGLLSNVLAMELMRGDTREPKDVKKEGGFKAKSQKKIEKDKMPQLLFASVVGDKEDKDGLIGQWKGSPFVSTTTDETTARDGALKGYIYHLDSDKISKKNKIWDVNAEFKKAGKKNENADEEEHAVEYEIPWEAVTKIRSFDNGKFKKEVPIPKRRRAEGFTA